MTSAETRNLQRMLDCISAMRSGVVSLVQGANGLVFLRNALEANEPVWADEFTSHLATIESAGLASPEQVADMGSQFPTLVATTLDALERMIRGSCPEGALATDETE